jgi:histidine phosphotransferase ChpT
MPQTANITRKPPMTTQTAPNPDTMPRNHALEIASLLCSRLCHDMLSPVGALSNGLELLTDEKDPTMRQRCFELLEQSARTSADKLKFFRLAFGAAAEPRAVVDALVAGSGRTQINWSFSGESLPKPAVKVLLNYALIAIEALVRGGTIDIAAETRGDATEIAIRATGPRIAFDPAIGRALSGALEAGELASRTAPAAMLHELALTVGGQLQYALSEDALVLGAVLPIA